MKKIFRLFLLATLFFTFSLTAGSNVFAALDVNVMPSGSNSQANVWDSKGPYTWPGNALELWGNVSYDGLDTLTYTWYFGAGEGSVSGTVVNRDNIAATHAYAAQGSFIATLTVTDGTESDSDTVFIDVVPQTLDIQVNLAIQKALKYLYLNRITTSVNSTPAYRWASENPASSAMAVLAFQNHGHLEQNDQDGDIFAQTVEQGLNYLFNLMRGQAAANVLNTNSDINGNGRRVYCSTTNMYHVGMSTMAIAGSLNPAGIVGPEGSSEVVGKTYQEVLEDMVDFIAYAQHDTSPYTGGWRYSPNGGADNSVGQWPLLGLGEAARAPWNINAPGWVKTKLVQWINYSQYPSAGGYNGGFGYTYYSSYPNIAKTGAGIAMITYAGGGGSIANAVGFIDRYWNSNGGGYLYQYNLGYHYAMYGVKKGMEFADLSTAGAHDWQEEYNQWYVNNQQASGTWPGSYWISNSRAPMPASFGLLVLAPLEACKPLADAGGDQEIGPGQAVTFDGSASFHTCPESGSIVLYQWDFDYDGVNFDVDATGVAVTNSSGYSIPAGQATEDYLIALKVTDNDGKISTDTLVVTANNGNLPPVADPGGPYHGAVGADITLDGSASYDENSAGGSNPIVVGSGFDGIVSYQWDVDGDGLYGTEDTPGEPEGVTAVVNFGPGFIGTKTVGLKVTDSFGATAAQSSVATTVAVSNLSPHSYELISNSYNRRTRQWTVTWRMNIVNTGNAAATDVTATWTPGSIPAGVTVQDDSLQWTIPDSSIDPAEIQLSDDTFQYTYPRGGIGPDLTVVTWDIEFTDDGGTRHIVRSVPQ